MLKKYRKHVEERAKEGIPPKSLNAKQVIELIELLKKPPIYEEEYLLDLLENRIPPGVDEAAYVKAGFLSAIVKNETHSPLLDNRKAIELLGMMLGGYNIETLIELLDHTELAELAAEQLKNTLLIFDSFYDVVKKAQAGNLHAVTVLQSWAEAEWFKKRPSVQKKIKVAIFKVSGETNTDDLSSATDAWSRTDIPLHARAMYKMTRDGLMPQEHGIVGPLSQIKEIQDKGLTVAFVGDVIGTGSSRKSATNSLLWFFGKDIHGVPNKRTGGICISNKIAPIFFNTMQDAGALIFEAPVEKLNMGDVVEIYPYDGQILSESGAVLAEFSLKSDVILDEVQAGGRINLIIGRNLTELACEALNLPNCNVFRRPIVSKESNKGFTLAQKIVGKACGIEGIRPGTYCEPKITTIGSQDTTGPMTRDELKDLACLGFTSDLVLQSFCHTAAYPKPVDVEIHHTLPDFIINRGGIALQPGDGIIHSWLNRMLLPNTVGTGGDSHTRFPIGISFPAGSSLVAFAAATGVMPLDMPESILVCFKGKIQPGITLRDLVHAIPLYAIKQGLLTLEKKDKKNIFSGRILEIQGLESLTVEQAFELSDASAERSAASCMITLSESSIIEYLKSNVTMLRWMISEGYGDRRTLVRRACKMEEWLANPYMIYADADAEYNKIIEIDLSEIKEPILCAPNDPDDARILSEVAGDKVHEVFLGSCMTNIGHFRAAGTLLKQNSGPLHTRFWMSPPTKMDKIQLEVEGYYKIYEKKGVRTEIPGCSLCMGNQARVESGATVLSTSTRNFPNRLGNNANVYLCSAELASIGAILGKIPSIDEYMEYTSKINTMSSEIYSYLNFDQMEIYRKAAYNNIITKG